MRLFSPEECWCAGRNARERQHNRTDNPFKPGSEDHQDWDTGWEDEDQRLSRNYQQWEKDHATL